MVTDTNKPTEEEWFQSLFDRLARSNFRSRFHLSEKEKIYAKDKGMEILESHAGDFVKNRLSDANPTNDGKQTPMRGHPDFARSVSQTPMVLAPMGTWRAARQRAERVGGATCDGNLLPWVYRKVAQDSGRQTFDRETAGLSGKSDYDLDKK